MGPGNNIYVWSQVHHHVKRLSPPPAILAPQPCRDAHKDPSESPERGNRCQRKPRLTLQAPMSSHCSQSETQAPYSGAQNPAGLFSLLSRLSHSFMRQEVVLVSESFFCSAGCWGFLPGQGTWGPSGVWPSVATLSALGPLHMLFCFPGTFFPIGGIETSFSTIRSWLRCHFLQDTFLKLNKVGSLPPDTPLPHLNHNCKRCEVML